MRKALTSSLIVFAVVAVAVCTVVGSASPKETVVKLAAKKFEFSPAEIRVRKGEPVVLEITSEDVKHGFTLPDFGVRVDVKPGTVNRVSFTPDKAGRFTFACDVFCGAGHEEMSGTVIVAE